MQDFAYTGMNIPLLASNDVNDAVLARLLVAILRARSFCIFSLVSCFTCNGQSVRGVWLCNAQ